MKKFFKIALAAIAATLLTTVLVSATVAAAAEEKVEFESSEMPALNCSMALSQAHAIYTLLPEEIRAVCRDEFRRVSARCAEKSCFTYQGVKVNTAGHEGLVDVTFSYAGSKFRVKNATWESLEGFFAE